jgi:drug/metabolite transporter (DMT)-like permease
MPWFFILPTTEQFIWLLTIGLLSALAHWCLTRSYSLAPASKVTLLIYSSLIIAIVLEFFIWGIAPTEIEILAALLIVSSSLLLTKKTRVQ